ncbi:hypothetical protein D8861_07780 [Streptococcus sanguinis]|nr:hypothetical protein D8873_08810 [Streptococcus sanguinis]RSI66103.1 hypothetical protein D8861_07780 [Streptococcus sanguinis]
MSSSNSIHSMIKVINMKWNVNTVFSIVACENELLFILSDSKQL